MDNTTKSDFFYREPVIDTGAAAPASLRAPRCRSIDRRQRSAGPGRSQSLQIDSILDAGEDPNDYLVADASSPSGFVLRNPIYTEFPGGYNPDFGADLTDMSFVLGLRGDLTDTLTWDLSGRYAENEVEYTLSDTINPEPRRGCRRCRSQPGTLTQEESGINLDFVQSFENSPLNVAFGAEFRNETYKIEAGDEASVRRGPDGGDLRRRLRRLPGLLA